MFWQKKKKILKTTNYIAIIVDKIIEISKKKITTDEKILSDIGKQAIEKLNKFPIGRLESMANRNFFFFYLDNKFHIFEHW